MSTDSQLSTPSIWDWSSWMRGIMNNSGLSGAPRFDQPILPGWFVTNITEQNSSDPDTERAIVAFQGYGRQLGRMMDAIALLIEDSPKTELEKKAFQEFTKVRLEINDIKEKVAARRLNRIAADLSMLKEKKREEYDRVVAKLRAVLNEP
jgi:hypothetical protein